MNGIAGYDHISLTVISYLLMIFCVCVCVSSVGRACGLRENIRMRGRNCFVVCALLCWFI
jgi:hypothetical protein